MPHDRALERLRGFHDNWIEDEERLRSLQESVLDTLRLHGYRQVDVPVLEQAELFLRKNGAEMAAKLYSFTDHGRREVALRPEFTASVLRGAAERNLEGLWPLRLAYCGPVFRYERPQLGTLRQFTQAGAELLGGAGVATDVEVITLACTATEACGVAEYRLVLGHLGMINALLDRLDLEGHVRQFIVSNLEYYNRGPREKADIHERLGLTSSDVEEGEGEPTRFGLASVDEVEAEVERAQVAGDALGPALSALAAGDAQEMLGRVLASLELNLSSSTRTPDEILARLLRKARRRDQSEGIRQALDFVTRLDAIRGAPDEALPACAELLRDTGLDDAPLDNLRRVVAGLTAAGFDWSRGEIRLGMARGISYYTGMIFELYSVGERPVQLCGGGRYDGLARTLTGGADVPSLGFAFGIERLLLAAAAAGHVPPAAPPPVAVCAGAPAWLPVAAGAAAALRAQAIAADLDPEPRGARAMLARGRRLGYDMVVLAGNGAMGSGRATREDAALLAQKQPRRVTLYDLAADRRHDDVEVSELAQLVQQLRCARRDGR